MRLRYRRLDDHGNVYWVETKLPSIGEAMSIYIRKVVTVDEDFHYIFGYAFMGLFNNQTETPGVTTSYEIGHIENNHSPTLDRPDASFSVSIYFRQDPFKQTIYIRRFNILYLLAQLVGALTLLNILGYLLTGFWTNRLYNASMIKHLYKVKHTSAGRDLKSIPMSKHTPSEENKEKKDPLDKKKKEKDVD